MDKGTGTPLVAGRCQKRIILLDVLKDVTNEDKLPNSVSYISAVSDIRQAVYEACDMTGQDRGRSTYSRGAGRAQDLNLSSIFLKLNLKMYRPTLQLWQNYFKFSNDEIMV